MKQDNLENPSKSTYKAGHSTETTLLSIQDDVLCAMDRVEVTALTLLDLSAAFDTIDHKMLLDRLSAWFGFSGSVIKWFQCYLSDRSQCVKVGDTLSGQFSLGCGVPHGSVLGPLLFSMFTAPLSSLIGSFPVKHKLYADDTQVYFSFSSANFDKGFKGLQNCLSAVQSWMFTNKLKLNPDKTEFLLLGNVKQRKKFLSSFPAKLMGEDMVPASSARNLGVVFDDSMSMKDHIVSVFRSCYCNIRDLRRIRNYLDEKVATTLANALVSSRLDYCNSLFYAANEGLLNKLSKVQNSLAPLSPVKINLHQLH